MSNLIPRYTVRESTTAVVRSSHPIVIDSVPCWEVTRETTEGLAWHIGRYGSKEAANQVANGLQEFAAQEV